MIIIQDQIEIIHIDRVFIICLFVLYYYTHTHMHTHILNIQGNQIMMSKCVIVPLCMDV